jgi:hypothetical protein
MPLACSQHFTWRFIDGGGVQVTEELQVSSAVAARLGIPLVAQASVDHSAARTARVAYTLTGKMVAEVPDPDALAACCKAQPDQCSDRYVSEFVQGTGEVLHATESATAVGGSATTTSASGDAAVAHDQRLTRATAFPNPVYFAFKITPTPYTQAAVDTCPEWVDTPPTADGGIFVVGTGAAAKTETAARNKALTHATTTAIRTAGLTAEAFDGGPPALRADAWCVTPLSTDKGVRYEAKVLAFLSDAAIADVRARAAAAQEAEAAAAVDGPPTTAMPAATPVVSRPTGGTDLARIRAAVEAESFSAQQLAALAASSQGARLSCDDVTELLELFSFSADQLAALQTLRPTVTDPARWETIVAAFTFSGDQDAARALAP